MIKRDKLLAVAATVLAAIYIYYAGTRIMQIKKMQNDMAALGQNIPMQSSTASDISTLKKKFPGKADISSFVERLSVLAQKAGMKNVDIIARNDTQVKVMRKNASNANQTRILVTYPIRISFEGKYRVIAEFLKELQEIERYKKVTQIELKPGENSVKATILIDIVSFEGADAA